MRYDPVTNTFSGDQHQGLPQVMWHITDRCALLCPYCFSTKTEMTTPADLIGPITRRLQELGVLKVDLGGGEPLSYQHIKTVFSACQSRELHMTVTTSGMISPRSTRWLLENASGFSRVIVSIDGPTVLHDRLRGRVGTYRSATTLVGNLLSLGASVRVNTVITHPLIADSLIEDLIVAVVNLSVPEWCLIQPHPSNEKTRFREFATSTDTYMSAVRTIRAATGARIAILERPLRAYAGYWTLDASGYISPQTEGSEDGEGFHLLDTPLEQALFQLSQVPIKAPRE